MNMPLSGIFFIYGLAFFSMGLAVALEVWRGRIWPSRPGAQLSLSCALRPLALFGLLHGTHEWVEMFQLIGGVGLREWPPYLEWARIGLLGLSFLMLVLFGSCLLLPPRQHRMRVLASGAALTLLWLIGLVALNLTIALPTDRVAAGDAWTRYSLGISGAVLGAVGLLKQRRTLPADLPRIGLDLSCAAVAFFVYGAVGQLFVGHSLLFPSTVLNADVFERWLGFPIQLLRATMAVTTTVFILRALRLFEIEGRRSLTEALKAKDRSAKEAARLNRQLQQAARELSTLYQMLRTLNENASKGPPELAAIALSSLRQLLPSVRAAVLLLQDPASPGGLLTCEDGFEPGDPLREQALTLARQALDSGEPATLTAPALLAVPIRSKSGLEGALALSFQTGNGQRDEVSPSLISALAEQLAMAVENARMYAEIQRRDRVRGELLNRVVQAQEAERLRVARDLHDQIGQTLTALALGLSGIQSIVEKNPKLAREQLAHLSTMSQEGLDNLRRLLADLRPGLLDELGLVPALRWHCNQVSKLSGLEIQMRVTGDRRRLPEQLETVLFRIAQEALNNVVRHAHATRAQVLLDYGAEEVMLTVEDDGRGFDPAEVLRAAERGQGWGLAGIQERLSMVGGRFHIESAPGQGTRLSCTVPVDVVERGATNADPHPAGG
jgi:signal transduction histidine kinase